MRLSIVHYLYDPYENGHARSSNFICGKPMKHLVWYSFNMINVTCKKCRKEYFKIHPEDKKKYNG
jgi:hypothetical protein